MWNDPASQPPQYFRRDFLVGAVAGGSGTGAAWLGARQPPAKYPEDVNPSFAQAGEDVVAALLLEQAGISRPSYLDVGAFLPVHSNNTYLFYRKGGRGVLVEPNVDLVPELRARRPKDTVLAVGVGLDGQDSADYYRLSMPQWNTFDQAEAERRVALAKGEVVLEGVARVPLVPLNRILAEHFPDGGPDFLSVDIESLDLAVLKTVDFARFRPRVICTETLVALTLRMESETTRFLASQGYEVRGMTFANTLFAESRLLGPK